MKKSRNKSAKKLIILLMAVSVIAAAGILIASRTSDKKASDNSAKTTSTVTSAQSDFKTDDTTKSPANTSQTTNASGVIADTNGASGAPTDRSNATSSSTGEIVVYSPAKNALLTNGATVSGTSSLSKVSYRIVDTEVGMISTGSLNVVNGRFSGTIQFQSSAKTGKLDFFGVQNDGNEFGNLSIPVSFK